MLSGCPAAGGVILLVLLAGASAMRAQDAAPGAPAKRLIAPGPFRPDWESLKQYECPDWFRDAKFGIWAHWSAQCVPEQGDWYARNMYMQGSAHYKHHLQDYGHPSQFGFKDICHLWKAEKWDPERLIQLYKQAGAKYFVALANHHCNFDCWDSKHQPWNSVNIGPKKDLVGIWGKTARKHGLRFGVTVHCARSWSWYEVAHGSDKDGPKKGVPYDGALTKADGQGKWWEGYDPQDLYCRTHKPGEKPDEAYVEKFFLRVKDLIDQHDPDLLYFDDSRLPLGEAGLSIAAHYYNANIQRHGGKLEAVLTTKNMPADLRKTLIWDIERGRSGRLEPYPWQTDTCIGNWHYRRGARYKTAQTVITTLVDIVSKNGNLLLNIPVRGDGSIDDQEVKFLEEMAKWIAVNGEAIYGTRPWLVFGEGAAVVRGGSFSEGRARPYTGKDIRFTTKGDAIYAIALGWPGEQVTVRLLGKSSPLVSGEVSEVRLLGHEGKLEWSRKEEGLTVKMPAQRPCEHAFALRITGLKTNKSADLGALSGPETAIEPAADGSLKLPADLAELHGSRIQVESRAPGGNIGFWDSPNEWASWKKVKLARAGTYQVSASVATGKGESQLVVEVGGQQVTGKAPDTGGWDKFQTVALGEVEIRQAGELAVKVRPRDAKAWKAVNLAWISLKIAK
jgi:alpha-L-fucosidase